MLESFSQKTIQPMQAWKKNVKANMFMMSEPKTDVSILCEGI